MDSGYISALSALAGSVVGGLTSGYTTWLSLRVQVRAGQRAQDKLRRQDLYKDFIAAASKAHGDALMSNEPKIPEIVELYAMIGRMRISSSPNVVASAEYVMLKTIETYFAPNRALPELYELMKERREHEAGLDMLKTFSEIAREELRAA